jgi:DNA-directed RNA polymerase subunit RPC12/RpoP
MGIEWHNIQGLTSNNYTCGYCGRPLASEKGWFAKNEMARQTAYIYVCHKCKKPTFFDIDGSQTPGVTFGNDVNDICDDGVKKLYEEARKCTSDNAFTAAVLCCRKLLMHVAVSKGAKIGLNFIE